MPSTSRWVKGKSPIRVTLLPWQPVAEASAYGQEAHTTDG
jgi:hypothetical protein